MDKRQQSLRYKGRFISQKNYDKIMRGIKLAADNKRKRERENELEIARSLVEKREITSEPETEHKVENKEKSKPATRKRAVKRKALPEKDASSKRATRTEKQYLKDSSDSEVDVQNNVSAINDKASM